MPNGPCEPSTLVAAPQNLDRACNDDDYHDDDDRDDDVGECLGRDGSGRKIIFCLAGAICQLSQFFVAQLSNGLIYPFVIHIGGLQRALPRLRRQQMPDSVLVTLSGLSRTRNLL